MAQGLIGQDINQNYSPIFPLQHAIRLAVDFMALEARLHTQ
jgi:hypothetical protein